MFYNVYMNGELIAQYASKFQACNFSMELVYDYPSAKIEIKYELA